MARDNGKTTNDERMFSDKQHINTLTTLLIAHGVKHAVVCPGSRNAAIVHNFSETDAITCYPVTDERSAAFYALGLSEATHTPVVVCVTSGTALSNLAPAVAESYYKHIPLIVVSGDRPRAWIDQLDGQTMRQEEVFSSTTVGIADIEDTTDSEGLWFANRQINDMLLRAVYYQRPVHINMRLSEPLFATNVKVLPKERVIHLSSLFPHTSKTISAITSSQEENSCSILPLNSVAPWAERLTHAKRPMIIIGQMEKMSYDSIASLCSAAAVCYEPLSIDAPAIALDDIVSHISKLPDDIATSYRPDLVVYVGGNLVSKPLRKWLRGAEDCTMWYVTPTYEVCDPLQHVEEVILAPPRDFLMALNKTVGEQHNSYAESFNKLVASIRQQIDSAPLSFGHAYTVRRFEELLASSSSPFPFYVHYGNSMSVRYACKYAQRYIHVNRGVNGIDGSVSTAAGFSLGVEGITYLVVGDLSFFYDQNALWTTNDLSRLRILLLNNSGGGIFSRVKGLPYDTSNARQVWAEHHTHAEGICTQNHVRYILCQEMKTLENSLKEWMRTDITGPALLEVYVSSPYED